MAEGDLVPLAGALAFAGYEGAVGRSRWCGPPASTRADRWRAAMDAAIAACPGGARRARPRRRRPRGRARRRDPIDGPLRPGMVLGLHLTVDGYVGADTVLVTDDGPERLTRLSP